MVGAGVAGLAAAERLSAAGQDVVLHDQAKHAGGRCRSYRDARLERVIDNGSHLILSGNRAILALIEAAGASDRIHEIRPARFPFLDLASGGRWELSPAATALGALLGRGALPPGVGLGGLALDMIRLARARPGDAVGDVLDVRAASYRHLWEPLALATLNVAAETGTARSLWAVARETLLKGEAASRPVLAPMGLSDAIVDPLVRELEARGVEIRFANRLREIETAGGLASRLRFADGAEEIKAKDAVVLAVPATAASELLDAPGFPDAFGAIINLHYRLPDGGGLDPALPFLGLLGGQAEWLFQRGDVLSVTISDANRLLDHDADELAAKVWRDVALALGQKAAPVPPARVVKERRATIVQTPAMEARRPDPRTGLANLVLAGDWTATALPATIEGAARSGRKAAEILLGKPA